MQDARFFQSVLDTFDESVFIVDHELRYVAFNELHRTRMKRLYDADVKVGAVISDYQTVAEDRERARVNLLRALDGERVIDHGPTGVESWRRVISVVHTPLLDERGVPTAVVVRVADRTAEHEAKARRDDVEHRYTQLYENALEGVAYCRMLYADDGTPDDFVYVSVNPAFARLTGLTDVENRRVTDVIPSIKTETPELLEIYDAVVKTGEPAEFDLDFTPLGLWLHLSVFRPEPGHFVAAFTDVTASKRVEADLFESQALLESIVNGTTDAVYVKDTEGRYLLFNRAAEQITGRTAAEALGADDYLLFPVHEAEAVMAGDRAVIASGAPQTYEEHVTDAAGAARTFLSTKGPVTGADGVPLGLFGIARDITEREEAAREVARLNSELERRVTERTRDLTAANEELEEFVYSIAHDLRSPLRSLSGFSQIIEHDYAERIDETGKDYLRRIRDAAGHLGDLMDALLSLSRIGRQELDLHDVDLSALAREVAESLRETDPERAVDFEIEEGLVVKGDAALCEIVVQNLLGNAWKFSAGETPALIRFVAERRDGRCVFCVSDNGVGFDPEYAGKLFAPFERLHTTDQFPGTGIGLATVRRAVTRLGGDCWADAEHGGGARLYFTLEQPG